MARLLINGIGSSYIRDNAVWTANRDMHRGYCLIGKRYPSWQETLPSDARHYWNLVYNTQVTLWSVASKRYSRGS